MFYNVSSTFLDADLRQGVCNLILDRMVFLFKSFMRVFTVQLFILKGKPTADWFEHGGNQTDRCSDSIPVWHSKLAPVSFWK